MNHRYRTPLKDARGLGLGEGRHRTTSSSSASPPSPWSFLACWFLYFVIALIGADYLTATDAVARPWNATLLIAFLVAMFWHAQAGHAGGHRGLRAQPLAWR